MAVRIAAARSFGNALAVGRRQVGGAQAVEQDAAQVAMAAEGAFIPERGSAKVATSPRL